LKAPVRKDIESIGVNMVNFYMILMVRERRAFNEARPEMPCKLVLEDIDNGRIELPCFPQSFVGASTKEKRDSCQNFIYEFEPFKTYRFDSVSVKASKRPE
jgi:hypothetical protein